MSDPVPPTTWRDRLDLVVAGPGLSPSQLAAAAAGLVVVAVLAWFLLRQPPGPPAEASMTPVGGAAATTSTTEAPTVLAHAAGAVLRPGVYELPAGARVAELLAAAGGAVPGADLNRVNLAAPVADGSQVYVPMPGEAAPAVTGGGAGESTPSGPLDLNTATIEQLEELPGVGPATAQAILAEREKRGRFGSVEELLDVRGIGPSKLDAIRDLVTV